MDSAASISSPKKRALPSFVPLKKTCPFCSLSFEVVQSQYKRRFCSRVCANAAMRQRVKKNCLICEREFESVKYRNRITCCRRCAAYYRKGGKEQWQKDCQKSCTMCGVPYRADSGWEKKRKFCSRTCKDAYYKKYGGPNARPIGSRYKDDKGYWIIKIAQGVWRPEHIIIAEAHIGRKLKFNEGVHHRNGNKADNRWDNLEVLTKKQHAETHVRAEYLGISILAQQAALPIMAGEWIHPLEGCEV